jgi:hypothetical protein
MRELVHTGVRSLQTERDTRFRLARAQGEHCLSGDSSNCICELDQSYRISNDNCLSLRFEDA